MRSIIVNKFGAPDVLEYVAKHVLLKAPVEKQILVSVKCAGVNPVDTYIRAGQYAMLPTLPYTPGNDGAGTVKEIGNLVSKFKIGDRVYFYRAVSGSYAEEALVNELDTFPLHNNLSYQQGAAIGIPYFTAYRALVLKAGMKPGQTVLVHGASGGVGLACCQIGKNYGARVFGTAGTEEGLALVKNNGAALAFNHKDESYLQQIMKETHDKGVDIIVEMLANNNLEKDFQMIASGGFIVVVGSRGKVEVTPRYLMAKEFMLTGVQLTKSTENEIAEMAAYFDAGQMSGWLRPVVGKEFQLEDAKEAHKEVIEHSHGSHGKIVLNI